MVDGQRFYAASGKPHFMVGPGDVPGPGAWHDDTAAGHRALVTGLLDLFVRHSDRRAIRTDTRPSGASRSRSRSPSRRP